MRGRAAIYNEDLSVGVPKIPRIRKLCSPKAIKNTGFTCTALPQRRNSSETKRITKLCGGCDTEKYWKVLVLQRFTALSQLRNSSETNANSSRTNGNQTKLTSRRIQKVFYSAIDLIRSSWTSDRLRSNQRWLEQVGLSVNGVERVLRSVSDGSSKVLRR